ncbi:MAG TPA: group III truncated hemoglobin [Rickettsiales bacterium]|nr:group III truncated hemoglobin [Rickettsiales bacterium]
MKESAITEETIKRLVDTFYRKVRADAVLAPVFTAIIGESDEEWKDHLHRMYDFWSSVMLTSGKYHGNPLQKHKDLPAFDMVLFDRWLALFEQTAQELYTPEIAAQYIAKSRRIAESLKLGIYYKPDFPIA